MLLDCSSNAEEKVFTAIVSMCSERIKWRMRLERNYRGKEKPSITKVIEDVLEGLRYESDREIEDSRALDTRTFTTEARKVTKLIDVWIKHRTALELENLVEGVYRFWMFDGIELFLKELSPHILQKSARISLSNTLRKVSRYREAARFLYRAARMFPIMQKVQVIVVELLPSAFDRMPIANYNPQLQQTLSARDQLKKFGKALGRIFNLLKVSAKDGQDTFAQQAKKTLKEARIHAEVQLIFYCELNAENMSLRPRIVRSSKDACFLCNSFIQSHRKMHIPRCHGKLYPGWRLPSMTDPDLQSFAKSFDTCLVNQVKQSIEELFEREERIYYGNPAESTLSELFGLSDPGSANELPRYSSNDGEEKVVVESRASLENLSKPVSFTCQSGHNQSLDPGGIDILPSELPLSEQEVGDGADEQVGCMAEAPDPTKTTESLLPPPRPTKSKRVPLGKTSVLHTTGLLEIQIEHCEGSETARSRHTNQLLTYTIEEFYDEDVAGVEGRGVVIADVEGIPIGTEMGYNPSIPGEIYIKGRGTVVKVTLATVAS